LFVRFARGTDNNTKNKETLTRLRRHQVAQEEFWEDAARGDVAGIKLQIADRKDLEINSIDNRSEDERQHLTAFQKAAAGGHIMCMMTLLLHGADPTLTNAKGWNALMIAAMLGHVDAASLCASKGCDVNATDLQGRDALMHASLVGRIPSVEMLLKRKADPTAVDETGMTAISLAQSMQYDRHDDLIGLLTRAMSPNERLWQASMEGKGEAITEAIAAGAEVNSVDHRSPDAWEHMPALFKALAAGADAVWCAKTLVSAKASPGYINPKGVTAVMQACSGGTVEAITYLTKDLTSSEREATITATDEDGEDALMRAAGEGQYVDHSALCGDE